MGFELKEDQILGNQTIKQGTTIVTAISYRYTKNTLTNVIGKYFNHFTYYELETDTTISLVAFKLYPKRIQK